MNGLGNFVAITTLILAGSINAQPERLTEQKTSRYVIAAETRHREPTMSYWEEQIVELENQWEGIYEDFFDEDLPSLSLKPSEISEKLAQLNQKTGKKAAVIWITPRDEGLFVFIITAKNQAIGTRIPAAKRQVLLPVIENFVRQINAADSSSYLKPAQQLYQWIIAPIEYHLLRDKIDTLILCVGPGLRSFPFAALHDGKQFLIEKYSLTRIPGFNLTEWEVTDLAQARVLAMGASEFVGAEPLPAVAVEIARITPTPWSGVAILNQDFTLANLQNQRQQQFFAIVHLATHAKFEAGSPHDSYIRFVDTQLSLKQLRELSWNEPPVELLVLSACETALGESGAELGFVGLAVHAGVKSAIGSLWRVSDTGTLAMMNEFYWQLKHKPLKAEALRQAQIAMIRGEITLSDGQLKTPREAIALTPELAILEEIQFSHPYYWAGFSVVGNPF